MAIEKDIKDALKEDKLLMGKKSVMKAIKTGAIKYVLCPSNCSKEAEEAIGYYSRNFGVEVRRFEGSSRQLGEMCGKPFNIMLLGIKK